jgi:hypothetical protein
MVLVKANASQACSRTAPIIVDALIGLCCSDVSFHLRVQRIVICRCKCLARLLKSRDSSTCCSNRLLQAAIISEHNGVRFDANKLAHLTKYIIEHTFVQHQGKVYKQTTGVAMGVHNSPQTATSTAWYETIYMLTIFEVSAIASQVYLKSRPIAAMWISIMQTGNKGGTISHYYSHY